MDWANKWGYCEFKRISLVWGKEDKEKKQKPYEINREIQRRERRTVYYKRIKNNKTFKKIKALKDTNWAYPKLREILGEVDNLAKIRQGGTRKIGNIEHDSRTYMENGDVET